MGDALSDLRLVLTKLACEKKEKDIDPSLPNNLKMSERSKGDDVDGVSDGRRLPVSPGNN